MILEPIKVDASSLCGRMPSSVCWPVSNVEGTQVAHQNIARQLTAQAGGEEFLTVNMVMPAVDETAKETASFGRLLFALAALALERFGAAPENCCPDALHAFVPSSLAGMPADPFDGQLLRFRKADSGYQFHSIVPDLGKAPGGKRDLALPIVGSPRFSPPPKGSRAWPHPAHEC